MEFYVFSEMYLEVKWISYDSMGIYEKIGRKNGDDTGNDWQFAGWYGASPFGSMTYRWLSVLEHGGLHSYPLVMTNGLLLKPWPSRNSFYLPMKKGDFRELC